jgi:hypothetical protein
MIIATFGDETMLKTLLLGLSAAIVVVPAHAATIELACAMTPSEQQAFVTIGSPDSAKQVMHLSIDKHARKIAVWETSPEFPNPSKSTYKAKFAGTTAAWSIGDPEGGPQAHDSVDLGTNVLTTVDPMGSATQWNCSAG